MDTFGSGLSWFSLSFLPQRLQDSKLNQKSNIKMQNYTAKFKNKFTTFGFPRYIIIFPVDLESQKIHTGHS